MKFPVFVITLLGAASCVFGQTAALNGRVTDDSGAVVPAAKVTINGAGILRTVLTRTAVTGADGSIRSSVCRPPLIPRRVRASAVRAQSRGDSALRCAIGQPRIARRRHCGGSYCKCRCRSRSQHQCILERNATVITGNDLESLADDPEDLAADLQALAGPSAGPDGADIFIDGFSGGQLPPKQSIREVRLNQNPFAPEYDKVGLGRIEIFTKPGSNAYHGTVAYNLGTDRWNSRNPYAAQKAPSSFRKPKTASAAP